MALEHALECVAQDLVRWWLDQGGQCGQCTKAKGTDLWTWLFCGDYQMTLMGTSVVYSVREGKEKRDGVVVKHLPAKDTTELVDCSSRRHVTVSLPRHLCLSQTIISRPQHLYSSHRHPCPLWSCYTHTIVSLLKVSWWDRNVKVIKEFGCDLWIIVRNCCTNQMNLFLEKSLLCHLSRGH